MAASAAKPKALAHAPRLPERLAAPGPVWSACRRMRFVRLGGQSYEHIVADCRARNALFEDDQFPADNSSLFYHKSPAADPQRIEWRRCTEIAGDSKPLFFSSEPRSATDIVQGRLGNCWVVAAVTVLAMNRRALAFVVPHARQQEFSYKAPHSGCFRFRFFRFGEWIEVVVDDRLPTMDGELVYMHTSKVRGSPKGHRALAHRARCVCVWLTCSTRCSIGVFSGCLCWKRHMRSASASAVPLPFFRAPSSLAYHRAPCVLMLARAMCRPRPGALRNPRLDPHPG